MTPRKMVVVSDDVPEESLLGWTLMFSHPDEDVPADKLADEWKAHGLDESVVPEIRELVHVYQSACASVKQRNGNGNGNGRVEVRSDEVENNPKRCSYQITRVVWDLENRVIEHEKGLRLEFDKTTNRIHSERLDQYDPALEDLERQVRDHYEGHMKMIPGPKVRNAIRAALVACGAQSLMRKSGVYFIPRTVPGNGERTKPTVDGLKAVLNTLYGERGDMYSLPCMDGTSERDMLRKRVSINVKEQAQRAAQKAFERVRASMSDRAPRQDFVNNLYSERRSLLITLDHFKELVGMEMQDVEQSLAELDEALEKLQALAEAA